jgi:hypothetical protein
MRYRRRKSCLLFEKRHVSRVAREPTLLVSHVDGFEARIGSESCSPANGPAFEFQTLDEASSVSVLTMILISMKGNNIKRKCSSHNFGLHILLFGMKHTTSPAKANAPNGLCVGCCIAVTPARLDQTSSINIPFYFTRSIMSNNYG